MPLRDASTMDVTSTTIYVTSGDINGIGLRCLYETLRNHPQLADNLRLVINPDVLRQACEQYNISFSVPVVPVKATCILQPGTEHDDASAHAADSLKVAVDMVMANRCSSLVTLPINKHALNNIGWDFPGQTEYLAAQSGGKPLMIMAYEDLVVALATIHEPLSIVPKLITADLLLSTLQKFNNFLCNDLGISMPRIAVLGLNPHAGESGKMGTEEAAIIRPAIEQAGLLGIRAEGPFPADGFFGFNTFKHYNGVLAMYHDQGLIPLKLYSKGAGVNVTAGLPLVRTSPDHGTAYNAVNSKNIEYESTANAIRMCKQIIERRNSLRNR
ncbi:MAG: 4-hydroxythreonine-4-phosphate dehydrogenase PdxA [Chlorobi bacterium]|nr:MAG: 4-hydroxythreonine-4-phosphate dehydrogenase [Chlorobi bacterium OLB6]MBL1160097.1 4-hydroxythreonine-4-phosphate dehydrogenase PdxA [Chlorobiota bacterium]MBV6464508.1 4-hydroxythreonine-4-phosphate dehydrogenase [Chlorobiota bacterium]